MKDEAVAVRGTRMLCTFGRKGGLLVIGRGCRSSRDKFDVCSGYKGLIISCGCLKSDLAFERIGVTSVGNTVVSTSCRRRGEVMVVLGRLRRAESLLVCSRRNSFVTRVMSPRNCAFMSLGGDSNGVVMITRKADSVAESSFKEGS